jgi:hypothetical protein
MSDSDPTTYRTRSICVTVEDRRQDIEGVVNILSDKRLNFQTIVKKLEQKDSATIRNVTEPSMQTDDSNLGIRIQPMFSIEGYSVRATYVLDEWHNDAHEKVECEICGKNVLRFSYGQHKGSKPCKARKNERKVEKRNLVPVSVPTRRDIIKEELYGNIEYLKTEYVEGYINERSTLKGKYYARKELVEQSKKIYIPSVTEKTSKKHHIMGETESCILTRDKSGERYVWDKTEYADDNRRVLYQKLDRLYTRDGYWYAEESRTSISKFTRRYLQDSFSTGEKLYA